MTTFIRLLDTPIDAKPAALKAAVAGVGPIFECSPEAFAAVPGSPFAYWAPQRCLQLFVKCASFNIAPRLVVSTNPLNADFRFVRVWWETAPSTLGHSWRSWAKGGAYSPCYYDVNTVIAWSEGRQSYNGFLGTENRPLERPASVQHFFRPGLTWPRRTQSGFGIRALPAGCIFADKGPAAFVAGDDPQDLLALLAITTSAAFAYLVELQMAFGSYEVGVIQRTPVPDLTPADASTLAALARRAWSLRRALDTVTEISHAFVLPPGLNERVTGLDPAAIVQELAEIQREIDDRAFACYRLGPEDRAAILAAAPTERPDWDHAAAGAATEDAGDDGEVGDQAELASGGLCGECSWLVGVVFGRFAPRLATGERPIPPDPEPFDPLPARSPGMVPEGEEPADHPDILVDDAGHPNDLTARAQAVAERVKVDVPEHLRGWLARDFFALHIRMYSKSRRKAPIYWQLATPSASYSVWLYIHAFSKDTLFRVQNDYVGGARGKLVHEERRLEALTKELRDGATAAQRKDLATQETLVEELRAFLDEVKRVAPLWNPNLDDGVIINFAPLWRLVPQNKAWQKELKTTWDALCEGKYDWAHLAMHLWPERVVPKCATDRSLAIAHGLEGVFWEEGDNGKWLPHTVAQAEVDRLIAERTSAAVKDTLKSLLEAPAPVASHGGGRKSSGRAPVRRTPTVPRSGDASPGSRPATGSATPDPALLDTVKQAIAAAAGGTSKSEVLAATGLTDAQWNSAINALLAEGTVIKTGAARGTRYQLSATD